MKKKSTKKVVEPHPCLICGKMTTNNKFCSNACFLKDRKTNLTHVTEKIKLDNRNICHQCKKVMPADRYSMYCEECELLIED
jgi:hypothetical protein